MLGSNQSQSHLYETPEIINCSFSVYEKMGREFFRSWTDWTCPTGEGTRAPLIPLLLPTKSGRNAQKQNILLKAHCKAGSCDWKAVRQSGCVQWSCLLREASKEMGIAGRAGEKSLNE